MPTSASDRPAIGPAPPIRRLVGPAALVAWPTGARRVRRVRLPNLDPPSANGYSLKGRFLELADAPEATSARAWAYSSRPGSLGFARASAYFWLNRLAVWVHALAPAELQQAMALRPRVAVVPGGGTGSHARSGQRRPEVVLSLDPPYSDAPSLHESAHEYGHVLHQLLDRPQGGSYEEGFCDFLAAAWFSTVAGSAPPDPRAFPGDPQLDGRRLDLPGRFDDPRFPTMDRYRRGDLFGSALWDVFSKLGGRPAAAATVVGAYLRALAATEPHARLSVLAAAVVRAAQSDALARLIREAFARRGLQT